MSAFIHIPEAYTPLRPPLAPRRRPFKAHPTHCPCGVALPRKSCHKPKKYCSDPCRSKYRARTWRANNQQHVRAYNTNWRRCHAVDVVMRELALLGVRRASQPAGEGSVQGGKA